MSQIPASGEIILIDKPPGWTSFSVVRKVRAALRRKTPGLPRMQPRVGHAGTLDPLATGLLILCTGPMTREISRFQLMEKEYTGTFFLGAETDSYDLETEPVRFKDFSHISESMIAGAVRDFTGEVWQIPPSHSAVMTGGQRAYEKARQGQPVTLAPRQVTIREFEILRIDLPCIDFRVVCSKGTYIRTLAYDFGRSLNTGAYLHALRRVRIGPYCVDKALAPEQFLQEPAADDAGR